MTSLFTYSIITFQLNMDFGIVVPSQMKLNDALSGSVEALLDEANDKAWPAISKLLQCETESAISGFSNAVTGFELDEQTNEEMITHL